MKRLQPKTLRVYLAVLANRRFSQRGLFEALNLDGSVSIGHVNGAVNDLILKRLVERDRDRPAGRDIAMPRTTAGQQTGSYILVDPVGLLNLISLFRRMPELRLFTRNVRAARADVIKELSAKGALFCIGSAMEMYSTHFRSEEVSFYAEDPESLRLFLETAPAGNTRVSCYRQDYVRAAGEVPALFRDPMFAKKIRRTSLTSKVQTAIDMFCDGKGAYAAPLLQELWDVGI